MEQIFYHLFGQIANILLFCARFSLTLRYRVDNDVGEDRFCRLVFYFIVILHFSFVFCLLSPNFFVPLHR